MARTGSLSPAVKREDKNSRTDRAARGIIEAEDEVRRQKIERLKAARLEREAELALSPPKAPVRRARPASRAARRVTA